MKKILLLFCFLYITQANAQCTILHNFAAAPDGRAPFGSLISDGTFLYGMTFNAGTNNMGTIFKIMPNGSGYVKLFDFSSGSDPEGSLFFDGTFLYGMTMNGGTNNLGTVFKIMPNGTGYVTLLNLTGTANGSSPRGSLISDGTFLYGMTYSGGTNNIGTIFKIMPNGTGYTKLLDFANIANGGQPYGSLIYDGTFLYGMASIGGVNDSGTVFKIKPDGSGYMKLLDFAGTTNGSSPYSDLYYDGTFLYGTTMNGGISGDGVIFKIKPDGSGYIKLLDFNGTNGQWPRGFLISDGTFLYGMTMFGGAHNNGVVFKIMPNGTGYADLLDFSGVINGSYPYGSLLLNNGCLYGMTTQGGVNNDGAVFSLCGGMGIEPVMGEQISIYPNPTGQQFTIKTNTAGKLTVDLYDVNGIRVLNKIVISTADIDANSLDNGVYTLTITNSSGITNKKLVITH
jgi:uncharacterized repeat protein (TIGR03803 family)